MSSNPTFSPEQLFGHLGWARALARRLVADAATAEDIVQETWISALREQPSTDRPLRPWLERVIRNLSANSRRARKTRARHERAARGSVDEAATSKADAPDEVVAKAEAQQRLVSTVLALDEPYRSVVLLRYFEELSAAEIARRTSTPAGTVRWRLSEGLRLLRERLDASEKGDTRAWCAMLLPLAEFPLTAAAPPAVAAAGAGKHSSFLSILRGAIVMKSVWIPCAAAVGVLLALQAQQIWFSSPVKPNTNEVAARPVPSSTADGTRVDADAVVYLRSQAPPATAIADRTAGSGEPATPTWQASTRVRFVDPSGQGVAGVAVKIGGRRGAEALSDARGEAVVPVPKPFGAGQQHTVALMLTATHEGYASVRRSVPVAMLRGDGDAVQLAPVTLEVGASVEGTVVDAQGRPAPSVRVSVDGRGGTIARSSNPLAAMPASRDRVGEAAAETDARGYFLLTGLLPGTNVVEASVHRDGSLANELFATRPVTVEAGRTARADLTLARRFAERDVLTITVLDPNRRPVARAMIEAQSNRGNGRTYTEDDGVARVAFTNSGSSIELTVSAPNQEYPNVVRSARLGEAITIEFERGQPLPITLTSDAGRRIQRADVRLQTVASSGFLGFGAKRPVDLRTGEFEVQESSGRIEGINLPNQPFVVRVHADGHQDGEFGPFEPHQVRDGLAIELEASPIVTGRVVDGDNRPVTAAEVTLHRRPQRNMTVNGFAVWLDPRAQETDVTDANGEFELTLRGTEQFFVRVTADGFAPAQSGEQTVQQSAAAAGKALDSRPDDLRLDDFRLDQGGVITGRVIAANGRPAAGAIVAATRGDGHARSVRTDLDGNYRFERMLPGRYLVLQTGRDIVPGETSWRTSFGSAIRELPVTNCDVHTGASSRFDIGPRYVLGAELTGRIAIDGWQLAGQSLTLEPADIEEGQVATHSWTTQLDADGSFRLADLPCNRVQLRLADGRRLIEADLELAAGSNEFELALATRQVTISDLPTDTANRGATFVMASWSQGRTRIRIPLTVDAEGSARATLPLGTVQLERSPTAADIGTLIARGGIALVPLRTLRIE